MQVCQTASQIPVLLPPCGHIFFAAQPLIPQMYYVNIYMHNAMCLPLQYHTEPLYPILKISYTPCVHHSLLLKS